MDEWRKCPQDPIHNHNQRDGFRKYSKNTKGNVFDEFIFKTESMKIGWKLN
jgi:hypothetical protein